MTTAEQVTTLEDALKLLTVTRENFDFQEVDDLQEIHTRAHNIETNLNNEFSKQETEVELTKRELDKIEQEYNESIVANSTQEDEYDENAVNNEIKDYTSKIEALSSKIDDLDNQLNKGAQETFELKKFLKEEIVWKKLWESGNYLKLQVYKELGLVLDEENMDLYINDEDVISVSDFQQLSKEAKRELTDEIWSKIGSEQI